MIIEIDEVELGAIIDEETRTMQRCPNYSKFDTVIGEVNGQVVVLTIMNKATACDEFDGDDYTNLNLVEQKEEE